MMMKNDHHCTSVAISKVFVIGLIWFFVLNAKLALHLFTTSHDAVHTRDSLPSTFLKHMWDSSSSSAVASSSSKTTTTTTSGCPTYGCPIFPEEYQSEIVQRALKQQEQNNNNDNNKGQDRRNTVPFASSTFAMLTRTSNRKVPPFNQDAGIAIIPYRTQQTTTSNNDFFIGIFDGHGAEGHITAQHFRTDIPQRLAERLNHLANNNNNNNNVVHSTSTSRMAEQIYQTFVEADNEAPIKIKLRGGCTGSVVIRQDDTLYFSNTGDSRSVLLVVNATDFQIVNEGPAPGVRELYSTRLDKANLPDEKQRIESMGGKIHIPPQNPNLSRVVVYSEEFKDTIGLAMSRSLGDLEWTKIGVIPDPIVDVINLKEYQPLFDDPATSLFVVTASDGMWDLRLKQWVEKQFAEIFLPQHDQRKKNPLVKLSEIIQIASPQKEEFYRDDITAIVIQVV